MIRVTSGIAKGRRLELPKNKKVTAVKEVVKLAIFSILGNKVNGATFLDLFAGSGNLGIEALSRGGAFCEFVDESKVAIDTIEKNLKTCQLLDRANIVWDDVLKYLANTPNRYDVIFADPYYIEVNQRHLIKLAIDRLDANGVMFLLSSAHTGAVLLPKEITNYVQLETRKYGNTQLSMLTNRPKPV